MDVESIAPDRSFRAWLDTHAEGVMAFVALLLVIILGIIDFSTPPEIRLALFYVMVIAFAAWSGGKKAALLVTVASSLILLAREFKEAPDHVLDWASFWNLGMQIGVYMLTGRVISALRISTKDLKWRVNRRAAALEREVVERIQTEEQLHRTVQQLRHLAEHMTDVFWMRNAGDLRVGYINPAYEKIWGRNARELYQRPQTWLDSIHSEDRERVKLVLLDQEIGAQLDHDYRIVRPDGSLRWIRERTFPIRDGSGKIARVIGIAEDNTERRRLEREIIEISDREHARIGQDLHDSLCQKLVAFAFDIGSLQEKLDARTAPETESVRQMADFMDDLITEARATARGLYPVQLEADGLHSALQQLAGSVSSRLKINCHAECDPPMLPIDNATAVHLYRIAQEAMNNAVKHAKASTILIQLRASNKRLELSVSDDGVGITLPRTQKSGMGLHIMEYRARMIGGTLSVSRHPKGGTVVSCIASQTSV